MDPERLRTQCTRLFDRREAGNLTYEDGYDMGLDIADGAVALLYDLALFKAGIMADDTWADGWCAVCHEHTDSHKNDCPMRNEPEDPNEAAQNGREGEDDGT